MPERITVPFKYIGDISKCSLMPIGEGLTPLQQLSGVVLETIPYFRQLPAANQDVCLQALSVLGAYAVSACDGKWSSSRWHETWEKLNSDAIIVINAGARASSETTIKSGFMKLFQMLECKTNTIGGLHKAKALNKRGLPSQSAITPGIRHGLISARQHALRTSRK